MILETDGGRPRVVLLMSRSKPQSRRPDLGSQIPFWDFRLGLLLLLPGHHLTANPPLDPDVTRIQADSVRCHPAAAAPSLHKMPRVSLLPLR